MASERTLRGLILALYGWALSDMLWTGSIYRMINAGMVPVQMLAGLCLLVIVGVSLWPRKTAPDTGVAQGVWFRGMLYALFALPAVIYLIGAYTGIS